MRDRAKRWFERMEGRVLRPGRVPGLRTAKTTLAAVLSYVLADALDTSSVPVLAPLTALLLVQATLYRSVAVSLQRIVSVTGGVLVAVGVAAFAGLTWYSLGAVVAVSLVLGRLLRLGPHLLEMPISAMLVLALGGVEEAAVGRVYETLIGAAVGVAVSLLIAPPLYLQPAGDALAELAGRLSRFLRDVAAGLRSGWSLALAHQWLTEARALRSEVARADDLLVRAEESVRLHPRGAPARAVQPRLRTALTGLEHCHVAMRELCRALLDRTSFVPAEEEATAYPEEVRIALARTLECAAAGMTGIGAVLAEPSARPEHAAVAERLAELRVQRDELASLLLVDPHEDPAAWEQHGALLTVVDRLGVEIEAAIRTPDHPWRPPPLVRRPRLRWWKRHPT